jgi:hypothetical protein
MTPKQKLLDSKVIDFTQIATSQTHQTCQTQQTPERNEQQTP